MAKKVINIIYNLVRRRLAQSGAYDRGPGITSLPNSMDVEAGMQQIFKQLKDGGLNPVSAEKVIKNEEDLLRVIEEINQKKIRDTEARQKAAQGIERVFDKMRRNIPLNPDDQAALQGSGFKTALDNFKGFEPRVIQGGKSVPVKFPKNVKKDVLESYDNLFLKGEDTKYDADVLATDLAERRGFIKEGQDATDMDQKDYSKLYSEAYSFLTELRFLNRPPRKPKKAKGGLIKAIDKLKKKFGKDIIRKGEAPKDKNNRKKIREMIKEFEERNERALEDFVDDAGGTKEGVEFDVEPFDGAKGGLAYMLGEPRENFADGGMSRRTFLKIMAALAAFPVVGKLAKTTKVAKGVKPIVTPTAEMPAHFPKLVEKIIKEGQVVKKDFVKKTGDVTTYRHPDRPDIELTIEGDGKRIQLDFDTDQGMKGGYEFRQGDIIDDPASPMRGKRGPNEFNQGEVKYRMSQDGENYYKDFEEGIDSGTENLDEFAGIKKQETSKSKVELDRDTENVTIDFENGGLAGLLGE